MMTKLIIRYKSPITIILALIPLAGVLSYLQLKTSLFPEITFPKIKIIADNGQQPVDKVMITVTKPLENAIKQVPGLKTIRSITSRGSCEISAFMEWDVDIDLSKQQVESRITQINNDLPAGTRITVEKMNPSILQVMGYSLESNKYSPIELKLLAEYTIKPYLSRVEGVALVDVVGGKSKEYWVIPDPQKMSALSVTPDMLRDVLEQSNFIQSNGYLTDYRRMYLNITDASPHNLTDIENILVVHNADRSVRVKDIARVEVREKLEYIKINANEKDVPLLAVFKQPEANLIDVSNGIERRIKELKHLLPSGVYLRPYYIQANFVNGSIRSIIDALLLGLLLAIIVAFLFLRSVKASFVILFTIPVTIGLTLIVLHAFHYTFNIMTLGAIAASIGLIIDDAIVVVEQIHRTHEENPLEGSESLVQNALRFLFPAMIGSSMSTVVIFIPFIWMSGVAGAYFKVMTNSMIITLLCSFVVTWIGLPVLYLLFSGKRNRVAQTAHLVKTRTWVRFFVRRPLFSVILLLFIIASIIYIIPRLETGFLPEMDEGAIVLDFVSPPGTSLEETDRILREIDKIVVATPEVENYSRRTGTELGFFITEPNTGDYLIQLKKDRKRNTEEVADDIRKRIESSQPDFTVDFGQVVGDMLGDLMASAQPIEVKVFGTDQEQLHRLSRQVGSIVESVAGTADVFDGITIAGPTITVVPNQDKLAMYSITPANFQFQIQTTLDGIEAGSVMEKEQMTPIRIIQAGDSRNSLDKFRKGFIFLPGGSLRPLAEFAMIMVEPGAAQVQRENLQSMGVVTGRLNKRDLGSVMKDISTKISRELYLPPGYQVEYGGAYAQQVQSFRELGMILMTAILLVLVIILFLFRDILVSFLIIFLAVAGIGGSLIALYITGTPLNVGSYTGIVMIVGIIGENAIFTYQQFRSSWRTSSIDEAITYAISTRLRPNLMTAFGAIIALIPLSLGIGTGAQMHQPLAIAVTGGFLLALPLLLVVLPTLLRVFGRWLKKPMEEMA